MSTTNLKPCRTNNTYIYMILIYYCIVQRNFTHLIRCQTKKVKPYIILNTSRKHVNYEEVPMNKPYNIKNTNICNGIFHISFFKALLINEGETAWGETTHGANRIRGKTTQIHIISSRLGFRRNFLSVSQSFEIRLRWRYRQKMSSES